MSFFRQIIPTMGAALKNKEMDIFVIGAAAAFFVCGVVPARGIDNESLKNSSFAKQYLTKYIKDDAPATPVHH